MDESERTEKLRFPDTQGQIGKQAGCESHHHMRANGSWTGAAERLGSWHRFPEAKRASDAFTQNHQQKTLLGVLLGVR